MPDVLFAVVVLITWISLGVFAVLVFLGRHGRRSAYWYLVGAALGPMMLPIAAELGPTGGRVLRWTPDAVSPGESETEEGATVLVALDGSSESDQAARTAARTLPARTAGIILVTVLDPDDADAGRQAEAEAMLERRATWFAGFSPPACEVACGDPAPMILDRAARHGADLLVLGRRGHGLSHRLLGSVADRLVRDAPYPVLLGGTVTSEGG